MTRSADAPTPGPSRVLPHRDGDGRSSCPLLQVNHKGDNFFSDDPVIRFDDCPVIDCSARNIKTTNGNIYILCDRRGGRDCDWHDDKAIG